MLQRSVSARAASRLAMSCIAVLAAVLACSLMAGQAANRAYADERAPLAASSLQVQAVDYDTTWYVGKESPYVIANLKQLRALPHIVCGDAVDAKGTAIAQDGFKGKVVRLADGATFAIAFGSGASIQPIGTAEHPFQGTFDGNGKQIVNLSVDAGDSLDHIGLFGYADENATIKNMRLSGGRVEVSNSEDGKRISYVGAIAGYLGGNLENCRSSAAVVVVNDGKVPDTKGKKAEELCTVTYVGGLVGHLGGDMADCSRDGETLSIRSATDITEGVPYIAGFIGGLVGYQGFEDDASHAPSATGCENNAPIAFAIDGSGGKDRFGAQIYSKSTMVGGIVGYTMGSIANCANSAEIQTGIVRDGATQAGWGAVNVGGIAGSMRGPTVAEAASATGIVGADNTDPGYTVWTESNGASAPPALSIENCANTGALTGLASIGGICGSGGAFTRIVGCSNTARVEGARWNKPCPAGIVGITNGDVAYCYNQGRCISTTGGGYYASGIAALLTTYNNSTTSDACILPLPQMYGCYVTGIIGGSSTGYRTAVLAGENDGYIHDNCFLPNLTVDKVIDEETFGDKEYHSRLVTDGENRGVVKDNHEVSATAMRTSQAIAYLNRVNSRLNTWDLHYVPVSGKYPQLSWQASVDNPVDLNSVVTEARLAGGNPLYSSDHDPVCEVVLVAGDRQLYQGADYKVVPQAGARDVTDGRPYKATIQGINEYTGTLVAQVSYGIDKESIASCTVSATPRVFNWQQQKPASVTVRDSSGSIVDPSEYTWETLANEDGDASKVAGKYYDYINTHGKAYRYDIKVTAAPTSERYTGETVQACFQITWASLMYNPKGDGLANRDETAKFDKVVWGDQEWDYQKALETKGFVKIKYTGQPIKPTINSVTYLGRELRNGTGKAYYDFPLDYDYRYIYGNSNPEDGSDKSKDCVDATGSTEDDFTCVAVRYTTGGNFDNYSIIFFEITPASIADDVDIAGVQATYPYTGGAICPVPVLTYNGMTLEEGTDYELAYGDNVGRGDAAGSVTVTGKGNYSGTKTMTFSIKDSIEQAQVSGVAASYAFNGIPVEPEPTVVLGGKTLVRDTDYTVSYVDNGKAGTASVIVNGAGQYAGSVSRQFQIIKAPIDAVEIDVADAYPYNGGAVEPDFAVTCNGATLVKDVDYAVTFAANEAVGTASATVTGLGSYEGARTVSFAIVKGDVSADVDIAGIEEAYPYTGDAVHPVPVVTCQGNELRAGIDYDVSYGVNAEVAQGGSVTVTGKGNFTGSKSVSFAIKPSIAAAQVSGIDDAYAFNGSCVEPVPTVSLDGEALAAGTDYEVSYEANDQVGDARVIVRGAGGYAGTCERSFRIERASLPEALDAGDLVISDLAETYAYNAAARTPVPTLAFNGVQLVRGVDFNLSYAGNATVTAAGAPAAVTITGTGNYEGAVTRYFDIKKGNVKTGVDIVLSPTYTYRDGGVTPKPIVTCDGHALIEGEDYALGYHDNDAAGAASVTVSGRNCFEDAKTVPFTIVPADIVSADVSGVDASYLYAGAKVAPEPVVVMDGTTLQRGRDYAVSYGDNDGVGAGSLVISGKGNYTGEKILLFAIHGNMETAAVTGVANRTYTGAPQVQSPTVTIDGHVLKAGTDFELSYKDNVNSGTATVIITGKGSYAGSATATFAIGKAKAASFAVSKIKKQKYKGGKAVKPKVTVKFNGKKLKKGTDYTVAYKKNKKRGTARAIIKGKGNFTGTKTVKFKIK